MLSLARAMAGRDAAIHPLGGVEHPRVRDLFVRQYLRDRKNASSSEPHIGREHHRASRAGDEVASADAIDVKFVGDERWPAGHAGRLINMTVSLMTLRVTSRRQWRA